MLLPVPTFTMKVASLYHLAEVPAPRIPPEYVNVIFPSDAHMLFLSLDADAGARSWITVTVELHVDELPLSSVTVKITKLAPKSVQSNEDLSSARVNTPTAVQLSVLPLLIIPGVIIAFPDPSRFTVTS